MEREIHKKYTREQMAVFRSISIAAFLLAFDEKRFYQEGRYVYDKLHPSYKIDTYVNGYYTNQTGPGERPKNIFDFLHDVEHIKWGYIYVILENYLLHLRGNAFEDDGTPPALKGKPFETVYWEREDGSVGNWGNRSPKDGNDAERAYRAAMKNLEQYKSQLSEEEYQAFANRIKENFIIQGLMTYYK